MVDKIEDPLDDIFSDLEDDDDEKKLDLGEKDDLKDLQSQLAASEKKIAGLLNETKAQRRKRQESDARYEKLSDTVNNVLLTRQTPPVDKPVDAVAETLKFDYDDDGNPVAKADQIKALHAEELEKMNDKIANLEALLQQSTQAQGAADEGRKKIEAIVGSDERFGPAYSKYQAARKWVEDKVVDFQNENQIGGMMTSGQALDTVFDDAATADFAAVFPGINLERIVTAEDGQTHFRKTLSSIATAMSPNDGGNKGARISKLMQKPSGLGKSANAKGGELSMVERLQSLSSEDLLGMDDAQEKLIMKALSKAED
jgi:Skp family chaperone for outer membrane proteins